MAQNNQKETIWIRLKRAVKRMVTPQRGDGGLFSGKGIMVTKPQQDSIFIQKDSTTFVPRN